MIVTAKWRGTAVSDNRRLIPTHGKFWASNPQYRAFKESMAHTIKMEYAGSMWRDLPPTSDPVVLTLRAVLSSRMDTTAILKAACDAVEIAGVVKNDNQIRELHIYRVGNCAKGERAEIQFEIEEVQGDR